MNLSLPPAELAAYLVRQLETFFPDGRPDAAEARRHVDTALERLEHCFGHVGQRYFRRDGMPVFDHGNTDHYAAFLYLFANAVHRAGGDERLAGKAYALNKALHALDVFYAVALPPVFCFVHPVGTVIGRAEFTDFFCVYQNCTVGGDLDGNVARIGRGVVMYGGSRIVGASTIGDNCLISAGASIIGQDVASGSVVFGQSPNLIVKPSRRDVIADVFEHRP